MPEPDAPPFARVGVIGDVHCEDARLRAAIETLQHANVDVLVQVGDIVDGKGDLDRCIELLRSHQVVAIAGNHERWFLAGEMRDLNNAITHASEEARAYLADLPTQRRLRTVAGDALLCHGVGDNDMDFLKPDTRGYALQCLMGDLVPLMQDETLPFFIAGHTHERMVRPFEGITAINAGTLYDNGPPGFILVDFAAGQVHCWDFDGDVPVAGAPIDLPV